MHQNTNAGAECIIAGLFRCKQDGMRQTVILSSWDIKYTGTEWHLVSGVARNFEPVDKYGRGIPPCLKLTKKHRIEWVKNKFFKVAKSIFAASLWSIVNNAESCYVI